jgi:ankyrin repeat protein
MPTGSGSTSTHGRCATCGSTGPISPTGGLPLHTAAGNRRLASVRRLLAHGADPNLRDPRHHRTSLEECQPANQYLDSLSHDEVAAILRPLTREQDPDGQASGT